MSPRQSAQVVDLAAVRERAAGRSAAPRPGTVHRGAVDGGAVDGGAVLRGSVDGRSVRRGAVHGAAMRQVVRREPPPLRLTRRGRAVVTMAAAAVMAVILALVVPRASLAWSDEPPRGHLVLAGESLWEIAATLDPDADTREVVDRLVRINHLSSSELEPGQFLLLDG